MTVADADGVTHTYGFRARSLRDAKRSAREWAVRTEWCTGIVSVTPEVEVEGSARRLLAIAGLTLAAATPAIAAAMLIGLRLEGAL